VSRAPRVLAALVLVLLALLTGCTSGSSDDEAAPTPASSDLDSLDTDLAPCPEQPDQPAADSDLPATVFDCFGGGTLDLSRAPGVPTVVNLWASWCGPCERELPLYQAFAKKHAGTVDVLGVDWQETQKKKARALARRSGVTYPLVADPDGKLRAQALPKLILVDPEGKVAHEEYVEITSVAQLERLVETHLKVAS
jgi:thiol-disulfide isomerase/thioredoxin